MTFDQIVHGVPIASKGTNPDAGAIALSRLIDAFHRETPLEMGLREAVQNGIDAVIRKAQERLHDAPADEAMRIRRILDGEEEGELGKVHVGPWGKDPRKLAIIDDGISMEEQQVLDHLNNLANSGNLDIHETLSGTDQHKGQGARTALLPKNKLGMNYYCLKEGGTPWGFSLWEGISRHSGSPLYELRNHRMEDGSISWQLGTDESNFYSNQSEQNRDFVLKKGHGTALVLMGNSPEEETVKMLGSSAASGYWGKTRFLNSRYFTIPKGVCVNVAAVAAQRPAGAKRGDKKSKSIWADTRNITGMSAPLAYTSRRSSEEKHGGKPCSGELAGLQFNGVEFDLLWWVLDVHAREGSSSNRERRFSYDTWNSTGHCGMVFDNEVYVARGNYKAPGTARSAELQRFGMWGNNEPIVLYLRIKSGVTVNSVRTQLIYTVGDLAGQVVGVTDFADYVRQNLPGELISRLEELNAGSSNKFDNYDFAKMVKEALDIRLPKGADTDSDGEQPAGAVPQGRRSPSEPDPDKERRAKDKPAEPTGVRPRRRREAGEEGSHGQSATDSLKPPLISHFDWEEYAAMWDPFSQVLSVNESWKLLGVIVENTLRAIAQGDPSMMESEAVRAQVKDWYLKELSVELLCKVVQVAEQASVLGMDQTTATSEFLSQSALTAVAMQGRFSTQYVRRVGKGML